MKTMQTFLDKAAISLSFLCVIHCLLQPIVVSIIPVMVVLPMEGELFHKLLVLLILPTSLIGLVLGCKKHQRWKVIAWGVSGVFIVVFAAVFGHHLNGETGEKLLTLIGSMMISWGHIQNYRLCRAVACH